MNHSKNLFDDYHHTFIIAEAGSNWKCGSYEEDLEQAKKLIKIASISGADAVNFKHIERIQYMRTKQEKANIFQTKVILKKSMKFLNIFQCHMK